MRTSPFLLGILAGNCRKWEELQWGICQIQWQMLWILSIFGEKIGQWYAKKWTIHTQSVTNCKKIGLFKTMPKFLFLVTLSSFTFDLPFYIWKLWRKRNLFGNFCFFFFNNCRHTFVQIAHFKPLANSNSLVHLGIIFQSLFNQISILI